jgi:hypothetical protein
MARYRSVSASRCSSTRCKTFQTHDEAIQHVLRHANGYPYFIQQFGQSTWDGALVAPIQLADASIGVDNGLARLDAGFFRARWDRSTAGERDYLSAMARDGDGPSQSGEIARRLNRKAASIGVVRGSLMRAAIHAFWL